MSEATTYLTLQEVSKLLKCTTRTVYRKMDAIDTPDNLAKKGFIQYEIHSNGNNRRLISKEWVINNLSTNEKIVKPRTSEKASYINTLSNQLSTKDKIIQELTENNKDLIQNNQALVNRIEEIATLLHNMEQRTLEMEAQYHINGMENSPRLTTTKQNLESNDNRALSIDINEIDSSEKTMSEWLNQLSNK